MIRHQRMAAPDNARETLDEAGISERELDEAVDRLDKVAHCWHALGGGEPMTLTGRGPNDVLPGEECRAEFGAFRSGLQPFSLASSRSSHDRHAVAVRRSRQGRKDWCMTRGELIDE